MRRLAFFAGLSLLLHAILSLFWMEIAPSLLPAPGGTGEVTVEIVASTHPNLLPQGEKEPFPSVPSPPAGEGPAIDSMAGGEGKGAGSEEGTDPLLAAIRSRIERAKRYPELAQKSGVAGRALVHFRIDGSGTPAEISLRNSSGSQILDQEALATIRRAAPYPAYPEPLEVWIRFEINTPLP